MDWALKKWNSHPISIVILYVAHNIPKDYVYTPFGKLPARSVNDEKLEVLKKDEQERIKKLLSKYIAFCGKVPAEILEVDEPMQKRIIDLIIGRGITKLVMGFSFMKPSLKSKGAISGLFYVHQHKPGFCELFIICSGKQVFLRGNNDEKIMEDDSGVMVAKLRDKVSFKDWLDKMFNDKTNDYSQDRSACASPSSTNLGQNQWEFYLQEIENYYQELLSSNLEEDSDDSQISPIEPHVTERNNASNNMSTGEKIEILKNKLNEARKTIQLKKKEAKENIEKQTKAEWAISLCNSRDELQRTNLELESHKENIQENQEKIKLNKQLLFLFRNIVEGFCTLLGRRDKAKPLPFKMESRGPWGFEGANERNPRISSKFVTPCYYMNNSKAGVSGAHCKGRLPSNFCRRKLHYKLIEEMKSQSHICSSYLFFVYYHLIAFVILGLI